MPPHGFDTTIVFEIAGGWGRIRLPPPSGGRGHGNSPGGAGLKCILTVLQKQSLVTSTKATEQKLWSHPIAWHASIDP